MAHAARPQQPRRHAGGTARRQLQPSQWYAYRALGGTTLERVPQWVLAALERGSAVPRERPDASRQTTRSLWRTAQAAISARVERPSLARMFDTCTAAVFGEMNSRSASWPLVSPSATQRGDLPLARRQLAVGARRRPLQPAGQASARSLRTPGQRPKSSSIARRIATSAPARSPVPSRASASAVRSVPITGLARHGSGVASTAPSAATAAASSPSASASSPSPWARMAAPRRVVGEPAVEHPLADVVRRDAEREEVLDERSR